MTVKEPPTDHPRPDFHLTDLGSGRLAARAFAVPSRPQRFRRPTDGVLLVLSLVIVVVTAFAATGDPGDLETTFANWLASLPSLFDFVWSTAYDLAQIWVLVIGALAIARRRWVLLRDWVAALAVTVAGVVLVGWLVDDSVPSLSDGIGPADDNTVFPALALAAVATVVTVSSPYLVSPFRKLARWVVGAAWSGALVLGVALPGEALCALAIGWSAGALVHLVFGSPGGTPSLTDVGDSLRSIGVDATPTSVEVRNGVAVLAARTPDGRALDVHIHGRDSWDSQFFVKMWRLLFYRSGGRNVTVNRRHQVEHQAYMTLFAQREGALVTPLVAAAMDDRGDAIFVAERVGPSLATQVGQGSWSAGRDGADGPAASDGADDSATAGGTAVVDETLLDSCWVSLAALHRVGIRHGGISPRHLQFAHDQVYLSDFDRASIEWDEASQRLDQAQMLASTAVVAGPDRAIAAARRALGADELTAAITYVQPAAMLPELRSEAAKVDLDIDDLRKATVESVGAEEQELQTIRRFSAGNVVMWILLLIVAWAIIGAVQEVGVSSIVDAVQAASLPILLLALVIGQTPRFAGALAVSQASPIPVPYGRLTLLEFAITFVNLAVPSTAARVAVNIRFFQRNGLDRTTAIAVGGLDSVAGFVSQITLIVVILVFGLGSLNLDVGGASAPDLDGQLILLLFIALVVGVGVVAVVPRFRNPIVRVLKTTWSKVGPLLSSPRRLIGVVAANFLVQLLFSLTSYTVLRAFGQDVSYADTVLINECVALFAGLMPVPGGVGVTEAALTAGYTAIGVDSSTAMAAALCYRLLTFYLPPCFGYFAMGSLRRQRLL